MIGIFRSAGYYAFHIGIGDSLNVIVFVSNGVVVRGVVILLNFAFDGTMCMEALMRLQMWRSCVLTQALENLRYLRTKGQVQQWQAVLSLSLKRTFGHFEQPLPMSLDLGIPPLALQQAKQLCLMHFRYTYGAPSIMLARLYALRVANMMASPNDGMEHRIQRAYAALDMGALYPSLAPLPLSVSGNATKHKEKAYGRVLKTRVSEVWRQAVLRDSPRVTDGSPPQGRMAAFVNRL
jgi:hypothetical protein